MQRSLPKWVPNAGWIGGGGLMWAAEVQGWQWPPVVVWLVIIFSVLCLALSAFQLMRWAWHSLPTNSLLVLIIVSTLGLCSGMLWLYDTQRSLVSATTAQPSPAHPLSIIDPEPGLIRTIGLTGESDGTKTVYRNIFLLGVRNTSPEQKTIKAVQLKAWFVDTPGNCKISGSDETSVDLNPGDVAYFEIGYLDSRERFYLVKGFKDIQPREFIAIYHNAGVGLFRLGSGKEDTTLNFILSEMDEEYEPTGMAFQFSGDDMAPLFFGIVVHKDANDGVRLERRPSRTSG